MTLVSTLRQLAESQLALTTSLSELADRLSRATSGGSDAALVTRVAALEAALAEELAPVKEQARGAAANVAQAVEVMRQLAEATSALRVRVEKLETGIGDLSELPSLS